MGEWGPEPPRLSEISRVRRMKASERVGLFAPSGERDPNRENNLSGGVVD